MADVERERVTALWREAADALETPRDPLHGWEAAEIENARLRADCGRLREQLDALKRQQWSNQNRAEVAERGHKAALARDFEQRDTIKALREQLDAAHAELDRLGVQRTSFGGPFGDSKYEERVLNVAGRIKCLGVARAALGVEGEQEKP